MRQAKGLQVRTIDTDPSWKVSSIEYKPNKYGVKTAMIVDSEYTYREGETYRNPIVISGDITMFENLPQEYYADYYVDAKIRPEMNTLLQLKEKYKWFPESFAQRAFQILSSNQDITHIGMGMQQYDYYDILLPFPSSIAVKKLDMPLEVSAIPNAFDSFSKTLRYGGFDNNMKSGEKINTVLKGPLDCFLAGFRGKSPRREFVEKGRINPESLLQAFKKFQSKEPIGIHGDSPERQIHLNTKLVNGTHLFALAGKGENDSLFLTVADLAECVKHGVYLSLEGPSLKWQ